MDLTPKPVEPFFSDPEQMARQAQGRLVRKKIEVMHIIPLDLTDEQLKGLVWATEDGVPVESINIFHEVRDGEVITHDRSEIGFESQGPLYADKKKALQAAKTYWQARMEEAVHKILAIDKELDLTR